SSAICNRVPFAETNRCVHSPSSSTHESSTGGTFMASSLRATVNRPHVLWRAEIVNVCCEFPERSLRMRSDQPSVARPKLWTAPGGSSPGAARVAVEGSGNLDLHRGSADRLDADLHTDRGELDPVVGQLVVEVLLRVVEQWLTRLALDEVLLAVDVQR